MANIELINVTKKYGKIKALDNINFEVKDKEFFVLFGPAGAGKTTSLKTIAGVEMPEQGIVKFDGEIANLIEPAKRDVSMVFENYALYPHMSVFDNIASPLRSPLHKREESFIKKEVYRIASMMSIEDLMERLPNQLSNGQRQRVAIGRSLIRNPKVFLLDEPLAHLDAKLRHLMRAELKEMQANLDSTTIYVTHDYMEAMSLGDRIGIIDHGKIIQVGTANEIYYTPINEFVAKLMGEPEINLIAAEPGAGAGGLKLSILGLEQAIDLEDDVSGKLLKGNHRKIDVGIRGSDISYSFDKTGEDFLAGLIYSLEPIGNKSVLIVDINGDLIRLIAPNELNAKIDSQIYIRLNLKNAIFFDGEDKNFLTRHEDHPVSGGAN
jgi:multiple sugar transport system ATP-binding protein